MEGKKCVCVGGGGGGSGGEVVGGMAVWGGKEQRRKSEVYNYVCVCGFFNAFTLF